MQAWHTWPFCTTQKTSLEQFAQTFLNCRHPTQLDIQMQPLGSCLDNVFRPLSGQNGTVQHCENSPSRAQATHAGEYSRKKLTWNLQAARSACPNCCASLWQTASTVVTTPPQSSCLLLLLVPYFKCCVKTNTCCRHTEQHQVHVYCLLRSGMTVLGACCVSGVTCTELSSPGPQLILHIIDRKAAVHAGKVTEE